MSDGLFNTRQGLGVRAISFASSTLLVTLACVLLVLASRVTASLDELTSEGVYATIEERPRPQGPTNRRTSPNVRTADAAPAPTLTPLPVDRAMLARSLACLRPRAAERALDCPPRTDAHDSTFELPAGGDFAQPEELDLNDVYTPAELRTLVTPSCRRDGGGGACIPIGPRPPPPSRSAEEVCEAEGIGPCHPPPFRPEDVERRQHTQ